jgi:hypothetical protein
MAWTCLVEYPGRYADGRLAIALIDARDGSPVATVTTNVPEVELAPDEVLVKDYAENAGILDVLAQAGILQATGRRVALSQWAAGSVCRLLDPEAPPAHGPLPHVVDLDEIAFPGSEEG